MRGSHDSHMVKMLECTVLQETQRNRAKFCCSIHVTVAFSRFVLSFAVSCIGVVTAEQSRRRRELVSQKTEEYLRYAEALHQIHLSSQAPPTPVSHTHSLCETPHPLTHPLRLPLP